MVNADFGGALPSTAADLKHTPSTITFADTSGAVDVFTITGRVWIRRLTAFCTASVVEDGAVAGIELGGATDPNALIVSTNPSLIVANTWWYDGTPTGGVVIPDALQQDKLTDEDIILTITGGTDLDSGAIQFDEFYYALTSNGQLVAA